MPRRLFLVPALAAALGACDQPERAQSGLELQRDTVGDTLYVRTVSGSIWGSRARLEEDLSIGALEGADEYIFGDVVEITPDGAGGLYVFDRQVPALRHYDQRGRFIKTLGGVGSGPGEYRDAILGMALRDHGRLIAHDARNSRINLYDSDGTPSEHWRIVSSLFIDHSLLVDSLDHMYVKILAVQPQPGKPMRWPWPIGLLHLDQHGQVVDTMQPPSIVGEPESSGGTLTPEKVWALHPYGTVVGVNDTYSFEIRKPSGKIIRVSRQYHKLPVTDEEWQAYEARREWTIKREGKSNSELPRKTPRTKPVYRAFSIAQDGRIWVRKYMPATAQKGEPSSDPDEPPPFPFTEQIGFDVFESEGVYLGEILVPPRTELYWIGSDYSYGIRRGEHGEQYVVRLRIRTTGE